MKIIKLTQGEFTLVDDDMFDYLNQFKWFAQFEPRCKTYYCARIDCSNRKRKFLSMHRVVMGITDSKIQIDHRDHKTLNNCRSNLRIATPSQNQANRKSKIGSSKYLGVIWHKKANKWVASIRKDKKTMHIGCFTNEIEAAMAYDAKAIKLHGNFANPNFKNNIAI